MLQLKTAHNANSIAQIDLAQGFIAKSVGLLKHAKLEESNGLWIKPCRSIHTFFMRFKIDVVFLDSSLNIVKIIPALAPFRLSPIVWQAHSVLEFNEGFALRNGFILGQSLYID